MASVLLIIAALLLFGLVHSVTAGLGLKNMMSSLVGERATQGLYRILYNMFSVLSLLPVLFLVAVLPNRIVYQVEQPLASLFSLVQVVGLWGLVIALAQVDMGRFIGLSQTLAFIRGETLPLPAESLQLGGLYAVMRHPLYFFSLLVLWFSPVMTLNTLAFNIGATAYFIIGSKIEERRLVAAYGDTYRLYQRRVSWLIPLPPRRDLD